LTCGAYDNCPFLSSEKKYSTGDFAGETLSFPILEAKASMELVGIPNCSEKSIFPLRFLCPSMILLKILCQIILVRRMVQHRLRCFLENDGPA
jgi:hypothetical protein